MTVKQLMKELRKMPPDLEVYWADHDHNEYEYNSIANRVMIVDRSNMNEFDRKTETSIYGKDRKPHDEIYVVIRP